MNDKDYARLIKEYEKLHASEPEEYIMDMKEEFDSLISCMGDEFRSFSKEKQSGKVEKNSARVAPGYR